MNRKDLNLDAIKRQFMDLVRELQARKLAIPAAVLLLAIVAAMVMLPKGSSAPTAPVAAAPSTTQPTDAVVPAQVALISKTSPVESKVLLADSKNPYSGPNSPSCRTYTASWPRVLVCEIDGAPTIIVCAPNVTYGACVDSGSSGATGSSSGTSGSSGSGSSGSGSGGSGSGGSGSGGGGSSGGTGTTVTYFTYVANVQIDGKTYKNVAIGDSLPSSAPLVGFLGSSKDLKDGTFLVADGVEVQGVDLSGAFRAFTMKVGVTATLIDSNGDSHKLKLISLKVKKES